MMGPYYYYETSFMEDVPAELQISHDCMWSGECHSCQPARLTFTTSPLGLVPSGTVPISVGGHVAYATNTSHQEATPRKTIAAGWPPVAASVKAEQSGCESASSEDEELEEELEPTLRPTTKAARENKSSRATRRSKKPKLAQRKPFCSKSQSSESTCSSVSGPLDSASGHHQHQSSSSSSDNKKLRHREVEKNRHRQLQAMVKTLSEKIPGRMDKETQVQTMKRAARYCLYLRDVVDSLACADERPIRTESELNKVYLKACDNVEEIMSQQSNCR